MILNQSFGLKISTLRVDKKISRMDLAEKAGVSVATVRRLEDGKGKMKEETVKAITGILGTGYDELIAKEENLNSSMMLDWAFKMLEQAEKDCLNSSKHYVYDSPKRYKELMDKAAMYAKMRKIFAIRIGRGVRHEP